MLSNIVRNCALEKRAVLQVEVEMNVKIMEIFSSFVYFGSISVYDGGLQEDVKKRVVEGFKTMDAMKMMFSC